MGRKVTKRIGLALLALILTLGFFSPLRASAQKQASMKLVCAVDETKLAGMTWNVYLVGERIRVDGNKASYELIDDFADYRVDMTNLSDSKMQDAADTLENYAILDGIEPLETVMTDSEGEWSLDGLEEGLYLLSGKPVVIEDAIVYPSAILLDLSDGDVEHSLLSYAKFFSVMGDEEKVFTVSKIWEDDEDFLDSRPASLKVGLYQNGDLAQTVELSEENDWSYSWTGLSFDDWRVKELDAPEQYTAVYRTDRTDYVIVNTHDESTVTTTTGKTSHSKTTKTETVTTVPDEAVIPPSEVDETETVPPEVTETQPPSEILTKTEETTPTPSETDEKVTTTVPPSETDKREETTTVTVETTKTPTLVTTPGGGSSSSSSSTGTTKLPQTGQTWWPAPLLLLLGAICLCVSRRLHHKDRA